MTDHISFPEHFTLEDLFGCLRDAKIDCDTALVRATERRLNAVCGGSHWEQDYRRWENDYLDVDETLEAAAAAEADGELDASLAYESDKLW